MLFSLMILLTFIFLFMNHPLSLGLVLLNQTILVSLMAGMINMKFWFSYILFLILIGGLMILFIYMTSIASNEKFKFSTKMLWTSLTIIFLSSFLKPEFWLFQNLEFIPIISSLNKYFNCMLIMSLNLIIIYLLITLIAVVNMTNNISGPLRQIS